MVTHAAAETAALTAPSPECHAVVLHARDEAELLRVAAAVDAIPGWAANIIREPDEPYLGQAMALAVPPTFEREQIRHVFRKLQLAK
jgi:hypothetical protein